MWACISAWLSTHRELLSAIQHSSRLLVREFDSPCTKSCILSIWAPLLGLGTAYILEPSDTTAIIGQDAVLECTPPLSLPPAVVSWSRDFAQLTSPRYQVLQNGSLLIMGVELSDQATYYCTATNALLGSSRTSRGAVLTAIGKATILCPL